MSFFVLASFSTDFRRYFKMSLKSVKQPRCKCGRLKKKQTGRTARKVILRQSGMKAYEISEELGYFSADYFTKVFKEITGVSPAQYKQSL
ncbi:MULTISPECIES: helix-turn-helix domain-containing protein [Ruminococcus]|uniref:helix-turn-helix domain-containing protein n=2 Tax=Ruminococcus TaxID=1263 RepID=UPI002FD9F110